MALQKQTVTLNLSTGGDQKTDPKTLSPGTPTKVENAQFLKANRVDKRFGYDSLSLEDPDFTPEVYGDWAFSGAVLTQTDRIGFLGSGADFTAMLFIMPIGTQAAFVADLTSTLNAGGSLGVTDPTGVEWIVTDNGFDTIDVSTSTSGDTNRIFVTMLESFNPLVSVTRDGVASDIVTFRDTFPPGSAMWVGTQLNAYNAENPVGLQKTFAPDLTDLKGIIGTEDHLLLHAGDEAYSYSKAEDNWRHIGNHITAETEMISPDETSRPLEGCDTIHVGGVTYYALLEMLFNENSITSAFVLVMAIDESTGEVLYNPQQATVNEDTTMKFIELNGQAYLIYSFASGGVAQVKGRKVNKTGLGPEVALFNDCAQGISDVGGNFWDIMTLNDTFIAIGYPDDDAFGNLSVRFFDGELVEGTGNFAKKTVVSDFAGQGVTIVMSSSGTKFFLIGNGGDIAFLTYVIFEADGSSNGASVGLNAKASQLGSVRSDGGVAYPAAFGGKAGINYMVASQLTTFGASDEGRGMNRLHLAEDGTVTKDVEGFKPLFDVEVMTKPWIHDGKAFFVFYRCATDDTSYFFGSIIDSEFVANIHVTSQILYGRAPDENSDYRIRLRQKNITEISPGISRFAALAKDSITTMPGCVSAKIDFTSKELFTGVPYGNSVILAGSNLHAFGGQYLRELNFWYAPRAPQLGTTPNDGFVDDGSHSVRVLYEYQDKNGYLHRSNPGPETTIIVSQGDLGSIQVTVPNYNNSNMDEEGRSLVKIIPYRTTAGGSIYHRDDYFQSSPGQGATPYIHNNITGETRTITLKRGDVELSKQEVLFTISGEVPPTPLPPIKYLSVWSSRIWAGGSARDESIYFSKLNQTNLMPEFSELFSIAVQDKPGRTTGLVGLSDKIIMSKRGRLFYAYGGGPDNLGFGSFSEFEEIPSVSGVVNGKSMLVNRDGLNYKSDKGIYTLTPGLTTQYTGANYEDQADTEILKAIAPLDSETVRYLTATDIISYNNFFGAWSVDSSSKLIPVDATIHDNKFYVLTADSVLRENKSAWKDGDASYDMSIETGWISLANVTGFQRFYKLYMVMDNLSPYTVTVSLAYDYGDYVDSTTFTDTTDSRIIIYPSKQKCTAFRLKIEVAPNGSTEQSLNINYVGIVAGIKKGLPKQLPVSQRIGVTTI